MINKSQIGYFFLFLPLFLLWSLPDGRWEQLFTSINFGGFKYSWIVIFYILAYFELRGRNELKYFKYLKRLFILSIPLCLISLLSSNEGKYSLPLFFEALPSLLVPIILLIRPLYKENMMFLRTPFTIVICFQILLYCLSAFFGITIISYEFDETGDFLFFRPTTFVGGVNTSAYFLFLTSTLYSELFVKKDNRKIIFLLFVFALIAVGSCRGALVAMAFYLCSYLLFYFSKSGLASKIILIVTLCAFSIISVHLSLFQDVLQRNDSQTEIDDITNGRSWRIALVAERTMSDAPWLGVGHGRVFSSSKNLLYQFNEKNFNYSNYHGAPHNLWVLIFAEYGIIGAVLALLGTLFLLKSLNYSNRLSYVVVGCLLIFMNTESILVQDDMWPLFWILVNLSRKTSLTP